ncbi:MAG: metal ABC transporter ATP-binding protein [Parachlamydiaceae bacterium]
MKGEPALNVEQLTVSYEKTPVLWDISLGVPQGELVGILGPNGAGKSTFLKALLGFLSPIAGRVSFFGKPYSEVRNKIAYVAQKESIDWDFPITVRELVLMGRYGELKLFQRPRKADYDAVDHYLTLVGLAEFSHRQINELSGGQKQRAFLARALIQEADLYLFDEPFIGIDAATENVMIQIFRKLIEQGKTVFVVHHDLNAVEKLFSWVILLNLRLVSCGKTSDAFNADYLSLAYGKSYELLDEASKLAFKKFGGGV